LDCLPARSFRRHPGPGPRDVAAVAADRSRAESGGRGGGGFAILPGMTPGRLPLPDVAWPKARRYMRALRRGLLAYWYATLEGAEAATIEAATATWYVNILDEAVFEQAHGQPYKDLRANDRLGRVVMGLELIRNCETHASVVFNELLVEQIAYSVPLALGGPSVMRSVLAWAAYDALPAPYRDVSSSVMATQRRARPEALHAYRDAVQLRYVPETLLDAMAFFQSLDTRLVGPPAPPLRWAFAVPSGDSGLTEPSRWLVARPLGLDAFEPFLPDLVCRDTERRTAQWPPADRILEEQAKRARKELPYALAREVRHVLTKDGAVVGYSGFQPEPHHGASRWVERRRQVWQDIRRGSRYFVVHDGPRSICNAMDMSESARGFQTATTPWQASRRRPTGDSTWPYCRWSRTTLTCISRCEGHCR
jgi:hypothetical protein